MYTRIILLSSAAALVLAVIVTLSTLNLNNSCKTYESYYNIFFSSSCYYNPDLDADIYNIIKRYVPIHESHQLQTDDGYILDVIRIPRENPKGVILMQHPIGFDARIWVGQYNGSVALLFWRAGYDVWLGNNRGNYFCKKHIELEPTDTAFWNFSFHEMGYYDNDATIRYIKERTNQKVIYLGYSMGATNGLVYASTRSKEAADSVKAMVLLAPVSHLQEVTSMVKHTIPPLFRLLETWKFVDLEYPIGLHDGLIMQMFRFFSKHFPCKKCIVEIIHLFFGWSRNELDPDLINMYIRIFGSQFPLKVLHHYTQTYLSGGTFHMYDYGQEKNYELYGDTKPPLYDLQNIKIPVHVFCGQNDTLATAHGCDILHGLLSEGSVANEKMLVEGYAHSDFVYGRNRNDKVYNKIIQALEEYS